jgi:hypothetical protein
MLLLLRLLLQLAAAAPVWLAAPVTALAAAAPSTAGPLLLSTQAFLLLLARSLLLSLAGRPCFFEAPVAAVEFFHLPPVSTTPVVNLELRISPRIFEKI